MRTIQLYGTGAATANAVAQVTIPTSGKLRGAKITLTADSVTDNSHVRIEFSKAPASQIAVNGALDPFLNCGLFINGTQVAPNGVNGFYPLDVDVRQGEIIYLHVLVAGTLTYFANVIFDYA